MSDAFTPVPGPTGWVPDPPAVERVLTTLPMPLFGAASQDIKGTGAGQTVLLYKAFKDVNTGQYIEYEAQEIGDCVSMGFARGVDLLAAVEIAIGKEPEEFRRGSTEFVYGTCRVDIGGQRGSRQDGAVGAWAAKSVNTIGTVSRKEVGEYSGQRAKDWGRNGVPADLKARAAENKVGTVSLVTTYEELEDAIANGHPIPICSNYGFTMTRDANGFCRPSGTWNHCMLVVAIRNDEHPGACVMQSWGMKTPNGPLSLDQPPNTFWVDKQTMGRILAQRDSWALSSYDGYPAQNLPAGWSYRNMA